ncbi:beta-galactosidase [Fulvitalea axinellae]|uniref:Beta-galactosidase n=1 Tax=Fulvitalea axinellae TaxID=1182444 RepID=A0AAU9CMF1_9BACT|nr:beta-galactosidase [Fulvitalea axinellae]
MYRKRMLSALLVLFACLQANGQGQTRRIGEGWEFTRHEMGGIWEAWRTKMTTLPWEKVSLPHCFNADDAVDPDVKFYQGEGWYRQRLKLENPYPDGRTLFHFEGSGQKTSLWVYDQKVGTHIGGYDEFTFDVTEAMENFSANPLYKGRFKGQYPVAICADNTRDLEMIPSDMSDFNVYGGIYRHLNLVYVPAISLERVHVATEFDSKKRKATVSVKPKVYNPENLNDKISLSVRVLDPKGKTVATRKLDYATGDNPIEFTISKPQLWSPDSPVLYTCKVTLESAKGKHEVKESFGFRYFEFEKKGPFTLNGKRLLLRGTHRHEDHAGVGQAMTDEQVRTEMVLMKEMGVNFLRLGHYQQSRYVLELCDSLGILVWEEIPWCRGGLGGPAYQKQAKEMLVNMINQHYNHPSVIIWGLGNENDWSGDFEEFDKTKIRAFMKELHDLSHETDNTRKTAIRRCSFCADIVDVYSPSIWAGWYRGKFTDYKKVSRMEMEKVDRFIHVEWGGSAHAGRHSENPDDGLENIVGGEADERDGDFKLTGGKARASKDGDWSETYICNVFDWHLKEQETMPWLTGTAQWVFKDFSTPLRPDNPVPYVNQKGVLERDFTKKEGYYVFQSYWTEKPMVRIYGHSWETRWGAKGEKRLVKIYSNCTEVELFLNGVSLGKKKRDSQNFPAAGLRWKVAFKDGKNHIKAVATKGKTTVVDEYDFEYQTEQWGKATRMEMSVKEIKGDVATVKVYAYDAKGLKCLDYKKFVRFNVAGAGELIKNQGTANGSSKVQFRNGMAEIKVRLKGGVSVVGVDSEGLESAFVKLGDVQGL